MAAGNVGVQPPDTSTSYSKSIAGNYNLIDSPVRIAEDFAHFNIQPRMPFDIKEENTSNPIFNRVSTQHDTMDLPLNNNPLDITQELLMSPEESLNHSIPPSLILNFNSNDNETSYFNPRLSSKGLPHSHIQNIPDELHISIDCDDENNHCWRPKNVEHSFSSDFFTMPCATEIEREKKVLLPIYESSGYLQNATEVSSMTEESSFLIPSSNVNFGQRSRDIHPDNESFFRVDVDNHLRFQKAQLNALRYEVINAERSLIEARESVDKLEHKLREHIRSKNALNCEKLSDENSELRLEVQCLCMEVDYYVKGNAPLGEIDEKFYQRNMLHQEDKQTTGVPSQVLKQASSIHEEECEEKNKWECSECTFVNHPVINACEMCGTPRMHRSNPNTPYLFSLPESCYCHGHKNEQASS